MILIIKILIILVYNALCCGTTVAVLAKMMTTMTATAMAP